MQLCKACGTEKVQNLITIIYNNQSYKIIKCNLCKTVQVSNLYSFEYENFYNGQYSYKDYQGINQLSDFHKKILTIDKKSFEKEIKFIKKYIKPQSAILDVGCGIPFFLYFSKQHGFKVLGCDVAGDIIDYSKKTLNIEIVHGRIQDILKKNIKFNLIRYNHVFEHIFDPENEIKYIKKLLNKKGYVIISIPNVLNWKFLIKKSLHIKKEEEILNIPEHFIMYSKEGLIKLFNRFGFQFVEQFQIPRLTVFGNKKTKLLETIENSIIPDKFKSNLQILFRLK